MAILEVHDGRGRVDYITISHDHTALLGSDPKCDIVLSDPKIQPFHGRLRWKGGKFKAEAFPEAQAIEVNGKRVVAASFRKGDEIKIGPYRIFLQSLDDSPGADDRTREQAAPRARAQASLSNVDLTSIKPPAKLGPIQTLLGYLKGREQRPGEERISNSPLVLGLALGLVLMILIGFGLWSVISERAANNSYQIAADMMQSRDYRGAITAWDDFLKGYATDPRASKAFVQRALAKVKQFSDVQAPNWTETVKAAREMVQELESEPAFADTREELAALVLRSAEELADLAAASADEKILGESQATLTLHDKLAGEKAVAIRGESALPKKLEAARAAVRKREAREKSIAGMGEAIAGKSSATVYALRDSLIAAYPDFATDRQVIEKLKEANELVRAEVKFDGARRAASTAAEPDPLRPPLTLIEREPKTASPVSTSTSTPVYAMAEGFLYALEGGTGRPLWHMAVGLGSPFIPVAVPGTDPSVVVFDCRTRELVRVDALTGRLVWRQEIGETISEPPLVLGNQAIQVTPSGKLLVLSAVTGDLIGSLDFGRPLSRTPVPDESGQYFYVVGGKDCVFIVKRDPFSCVGVEYLGHPMGSIGTSPVRAGPYFIVPENLGLWEGRWIVYQIEQDGARLRERQRVPIRGWTWTPPAAQGGVIWSVSDRSAVTAFVLGPPDAKLPLTQSAATLPDNRPLGPAFGRARSEREFWLSGQRAGRFDLMQDQGSLALAWALEQVGPAVAPIQLADRMAVMTHQERDGRGIAVFAINPANGQVAWRTVIGKPWPVAMHSSAGDTPSLRTAAIDGATLTVSTEQLEKGGFVEVPPGRPGYFSLPAGPLEAVHKGDLTVVLPAADAEYLLVKKGDGELTRIDLPGPLGARPLFWGDDLVVPGKDGRVDLVDPLTGAPRAEPYVPPFDRSKELRWRNPVRLADDAVIVIDESGRLRRMSKRTEPRLRLVPVGDEVNLGSSIVAEPAATEQAVIVVTADRKVRALAGADLSALGAWNLDAPLATAPWAVAGHAFVFDAAGTAMAFGPDGSRLWSISMRESPPLGPPVIMGDSVWMLSRSGVLDHRSLADGSEMGTVDLGVQPTGGLEMIGKRLVVPAAPGVVRLFDPDARNVAER
jgi:outer membrane protein assembly factor BamB